VKTFLQGLISLSAIVLVQAAVADAKLDEQMTQLAYSNGCTMCHSLKSVPAGPAGMEPIAPSWQDIAEHYRGNPNARETLLKVVMGGGTVYGNHWENKVSGTVMPPNAILIKEADARKLVAWILGVKK
jgi:cytochrome c